MKNGKLRTLTELETALRPYLPSAEIDFDNHGQIVIYTGLAVAEDGDTLTDFDLDEGPWAQSE